MRKKCWPAAAQLPRGYHVSKDIAASVGSNGLDFGGFGVMQRYTYRVQRQAKQIGPEYTIRPRTAVVAVAGPARATVQVPKDRMIQHRAYMSAVRSLACDSCGALPRSVFCHADILGKGGKGMGIKSDCRLGWPGCRTCHYAIGTSGKMSKEHRHLYEFAAGRRTRAEVWLRGLWPTNLPPWPSDVASA